MINCLIMWKIHYKKYLIWCTTKQEMVMVNYQEDTCQPNEKVLTIIQFTTLRVTLTVLRKRTIELTELAEFFELQDGTTDLLEIHGGGHNISVQMYISYYGYWIVCKGSTCIGHFLRDLKELNMMITHQRISHDSKQN